MQHGMHYSIAMVKIQQDLIDRQLKYHYLLADHRVRTVRQKGGSRFISTLRSFFAPRAALTQERAT